MIMFTNRLNPPLQVSIFRPLIVLFLFFSTTQAQCPTGCSLALASYYVTPGLNLTYISNIFSISPREILLYNPNVPDEYSLQSGTSIPFPCYCYCGGISYRFFDYIVQPNDSYKSLATTIFSNLTTAIWMEWAMTYGERSIPVSRVEVDVACTCGDGNVSKDYGLFITYPLRSGENLSFLAAESGVPANLLERYNPGSNFSAGTGIVYVPGKGITVDKSVKFSYEELAKATNDFGQGNMIGQGGFGSVYYAELRGQKVAIKRMDMQASEEFLNEVRILSNVRHFNLVQLIGYCVEGSLHLVYEFVENGDLSSHLCGSGRDSLTWTRRMQIALDAARGLQYLHEHTIPAHIHRDIKSANILLDTSFHAKIADFGLAKLIKVGSASIHTRPVGIFGYMPLEYGLYGKLSSKIDVYAFGVVLFELISGMEAVIQIHEAEPEYKGLVDLFREVFNQPDPIEDLRKLVDKSIGDTCPFNSVHKMALLAKACTHEVLNDGQA